MYKINRNEAIAILEKALDRPDTLPNDKQSLLETIISSGECPAFYQGMLSGACLMINYANKMDANNKQSTLTDMAEIAARAANFYVD